MSTAQEISVDTSNSPKQQIKRSAFVYGKRSNMLRDLGSPPAFTSTDDHTTFERKDPPSRKTPSLVRRSPPAPSSPKSDDEPSGTPFQFDFRRSLQELDEGFDDANEPVEQIGPFKRIQSPAGLPTSAGLSLMEDVQSGPAPIGHHQRKASPLRGSLSPLPPPPSSLPNTSSQEQSPAIRSPRRREAKRPLSDSEVEEQSNSSVSPVRHPITTPSVRASSTPPTSGEMPIPNKKSDKAKGKAPARDALPVDFTGENLSDAAPPTKSNRCRRRASSSRPKTKAPTKRERREAQIESSRIAASRPVEIVHNEASKRTLSNFFASLNQHRQKVALPTPGTELPSDPIERFSSPTDTSKVGAPSDSVFGAPTGLLTAPAGTSGRPLPHAATIALRAATDDSDDEMPSVSAILQANEKQKRLNAMKQIALQRANAGRTSGDESEDDDLLVVKDDMHTVARDAADQRRLEKASGSPAKARAKLYALGHRTGRKSGPERFSEQDLREFAKPSFARMGKNGKEQLSKKQLDQMMIKQHTQRQLQLIKQHEEDWVKGGGRLSRDLHGQSIHVSLSETLDTYAEQGLKATELGDAMAGIDDEASADESDEDYAPELRGSASPEPMDAEEEEEVPIEENNEMEVSQVPRSMSDDDDVAVAPSRRNKSGSRRVVLGSDDEDDERPTSLEPLPGRQDGGSSLESQTEDENDKENSAKLMYDRSEDKENKAVVRHDSSLADPALGLRTGSQLGVEDGIRRSLSLASTADFSARASPKESLRSPLKDISKDEDDLFTSLSPSKSPFTERLLHSSTASPPRPTVLTLSLGSPPILRSERGHGASQLQFDSENDENDPSGFKPLQPSFLERLNRQSSLEPSFARANPLPNGGLSQLFSVEDHSAKTDKGELSLTLDVGLKPALDVSETLRRKAETIFEKEQEYVVAAAAQSNDRPKEAVYVNDHGFLTQTRPEGSSPGIYRSTPSQASKFAGTQARTQSLSERPPLRTLSFIAMQDSSPEPQPLMRLRRRSASPLERKGGGGNSSPVAALAPRVAGPASKLNAFDVLGKGPKSNPKAAHKEMEKLGKSEFVAAEAEESDEDDMFGFGIKQKDDDQDDDEDDQDKVVEGLVDDTTMSSEVERADLVQEKFREHMEDEDKEVEKLHRNAIQGKLRTKRRDRGVGFESDSDEEDDDHARQIRQKMRKKRRIEGDSLEALGQNEETRAFYNTYHQGLVDDDDNELVHLQRGVEVPEGEAEPEEGETVTVDEIRRRVREVAENNIEVEGMDPEDIDWIDRRMAMDDDEGDVRVKVMQHQPSRPATRRPNVGQVDFDGEGPKRQGESEQQRKQWTSWARGQSHRQGTGRSGTGTAVTGHSKIKGGRGSLRSQASSSSNISETCNLKAKGPSLLSIVSDRSGRFA